MIKKGHEDYSDGYNTEEEMIKQLGYGKSLFIDEADEQRINAMKNLEKEEILNERHQKMLQYKEKAQLIREYRKTHQQDEEMQNDTKAIKQGALEDIRAQRQKRLTHKRSDSEKSDSEASGSEVGGESGASYSSDDHSENRDSEMGKSQSINFVDLEKVRVSRTDLEKW